MCYDDTDMTPLTFPLLTLSQSFVTLDFYFFYLFIFLVLVSGVQNHSFGFLSQQLFETKNLAG